MDYTDRRSGRIVFMSQCLLNQNLRFPGIAVDRGACGGLVQLMMDNGIGIEPLPCLERLGWGGVSRKQYFKYQPMILADLSRSFKALIRFPVRMWILKYSRLCGREAKKIAGHICDYNSSGYEVIGIVAVNDSPTDGVTKTIDLLTSADKLKSMGFKSDTLLHSKNGEMKNLIHSLCTKGEGIFITELKHKLQHKGVRLTLIGYDPWEDPTCEVEKIAQTFGLIFNKSKNPRRKCHDRNMRKE